MEVTEIVLNDLCKNVPFRRTQIVSLLNLFGNHPCSSIFINGHTATGKTFVLGRILETLQLPYIVVNCVECFNARLIFEYILNKLKNNFSNEKFEEREFIRCENMNDFVQMLKKALNKIGETVYIALDKSERLRDMEANILPAFTRLAELTSCNLCVVFLSEIIFEKFSQGTGVHQPYVLHFTDYSKSELLEIMSLDAPDGYQQDFYTGYCQLLLSVFYNVCRNLKELRHLAALNFSKYCAPITSGEATCSDVKKLWKNIEPHLKKALSTVFLHEVSSSQWEKITDNYHGVKGLSSYSTVELPFYSKYMLIAAYLASHNPAKTDRQFFCKTTEKKMSKRSKIAAKTSVKPNSQLKGPHQFVLDRLMAIFYSIVDEKVPASATILSQLSSLVTLRFLSQASSGDQLDTPKYKCLVSLDFVKAIAKQLEFDLGYYLYDFV